MVKAEEVDTIKYTVIHAPGDIKNGAFDNVGNNKFWDTIKFNETKIG